MLIAWASCLLTCIGEKYRCVEWGMMAVEKSDRCGGHPVQGGIEERKKHHQAGALNT